MSIFKFNNHVRGPQRDAKYYAMKERLEEHYNEARQYFAHDNIVGLFCQGSQNYGLDIPGSDLDTKLIVTPTFQDLAFNKKPLFIILLSLAGLLICHFAGVIQFKFVSGNTLLYSFLTISLPFILKDIISIAIAYFIAKKLNSSMKNYMN